MQTSKKFKQSVLKYIEIITGSFGKFVKYMVASAIVQAGSGNVLEVERGLCAKNYIRWVQTYFLKINA